MMPHFFAGEVKFPIRQSCGENTKIGLRRVRRQLGGEKAIYIENTKSMHAIQRCGLSQGYHWEIKLYPFFENTEFSVKNHPVFWPKITQKSTKISVFFQLIVFPLLNGFFQSRNPDSTIGRVETRTNWPRKVRELILESDSRFQGVKG